MAKLRIFVSSTYFDLKAVRAELWRFIADHGYEAVEHEQNQVPYGNQKQLAEYCYEEIGKCDMLISLIGGRFGTSSPESEGYSVSQEELRTAQTSGKQVYIFVERDVLAEYRTWLLNRSSKSIRYAAVDNAKIYSFLHEVYALTKNNAVFPFITGEDIIRTLKDQWGGLFQKLLASDAQKLQLELITELRGAATELKAISTDLRDTVRLVGSVPNKRSLGKTATPKALRQLLDLEAEPIINHFQDLDKILRERSFTPAVANEGSRDGYRFYMGTEENLFVSEKLWDSDLKIIAMDPVEWDVNYIKRVAKETLDLPLPPPKKSPPKFD